LNFDTESRNISKHCQISYNELVIEKEIGGGSYGKVCLGKWNNAPVALKFCRKKENIEDFAKEIRVMMYVVVCVIDIERY
jgi:predicted Ser/Thr protein kinase